MVENERLFLRVGGGGVTKTVGVSTTLASRLTLDPVENGIEIPHIRIAYAIMLAFDVRIFNIVLVACGLESKDKTVILM